MPETIATADPKATTSGITKGITDKAAGKPAQKPAEGAKSADTGANPPVVDPNAGKRKYVVNGTERWLTPQQADDYVQKGISFEPRISDLARLQSETNQFLETLKTDPAKVLYNPKLGLSPKDALTKILQSTKVSDEIKEAVGQWYYENVVKRDQMDEKDRAILERDEKITALSVAEKARTEQALAEENQARVQTAIATLKSQMLEVHKEFGFKNPDSPLAAHMLKRSAQLMQLAGIQKKPLTPKEAVAMTRKEFRDVQEYLFDELEDERLVEELGPKAIERIRKQLLKQVKTAEKESKQDSGQTRKPARRDERQTTTPDEFREYLENLKRGK